MPPPGFALTPVWPRGISWLMGAGVVLVAYRTGAVLKDNLTGAIRGLMVLVLYPMFYIRA